MILVRNKTEIKVTKETAKEEFMKGLENFGIGGGFIGLFDKHESERGELLISWTEHCEGDYVGGSLVADCDWCFDEDDCCEDEYCYNKTDGDDEEIYCTACQLKALEFAFDRLETDIVEDEA